MAAAYQDKVVGMESRTRRVCKHCGWLVPKHENSQTDAHADANGGRPGSGKYKIIM